MNHGTIIDRVLVKRGNQVVKYWAKNGYAIPVLAFQKIDAVKLYTKYDGILYATKETFDKNAIPHMFGKEHQLILEVELWDHVTNEDENRLKI